MAQKKKRQKKGKGQGGDKSSCGLQPTWTISTKPEPEFVDLNQVKGLSAAAKKHLENHLFKKARFNDIFGAFEAINDSGTMIIRQGKDGPFDWHRVEKNDPLRQVPRTPQPAASSLRFLPLKEVNGLSQEAQDFLKENSFFEARCDTEKGGFLARRSDGKVIIRGGRTSPHDWERI